MVYLISGENHGIGLAYSLKRKNIINNECNIRDGDDYIFGIIKDTRIKSIKFILEPILQEGFITSPISSKIILVENLYEFNFSNIYLHKTIDMEEILKKNIPQKKNIIIFMIKNIKQI